jgi:predicted nucleic acid-binding Zn ribbon protein
VARSLASDDDAAEEEECRASSTREIFDDVGLIFGGIGTAVI